MIFLAQTGLDRPSAVICDWVNEDGPEDDIVDFGNILWGETLVDAMTTKVVNDQE